MNPQTPIGQLNASIQAGVPAPAQVSGSSPNFDPGMTPPVNTPMPEKSPASLLSKHPHPVGRAFERRGLPVPPQVEAMLGQNGQPVPNGMQNPPPAAQAFQSLPPHPVQNMPPTNLTSPQVPGAPVEKPLSEAEALVKALEKIAGTFGKRLDKHSEHETAIREHLFPPKEESTSEEK